MERVQFHKWVKWVPWLLAGWWPEAILSSLPGSPRPQSKQAWRARDRNLSKMKISLCNLITEVISHHLYCIRFIKNHHYQVQLTFKGRGLHEGVATRKWGHWAPGQQQQYRRQGQTQHQLGCYWCVVFLFVCFLGLHLPHMEVPGQGLKWELQLRPMPQPHQMSDPSSTCELGHSLWQPWIFNFLSEDRDWTHTLTDTSQVLHLLSHNGNNGNVLCIVNGSWYFCDNLRCRVLNSSPNSASHADPGYILKFKLLLTEALDVEWERKLNKGWL